MVLTDSATLLDSTSFFCFSVFPPPRTATLSLHDALPISGGRGRRSQFRHRPGEPAGGAAQDLRTHTDRKSTRLNSSHRCISYAVFCLKNKSDKQPCHHSHPRPAVHPLPPGASHPSRR